jgi:outer membrane protein assembly factor BamB
MSILSHFTFRSRWGQLLSAAGALTMSLPSVHASEAPAKDAGWPQWRGPHRDGTVASTPAWPSSLGEEFFERTWRIDLGPGYSGPLVTGGLVVTTETEGKATEVVRALKVETGEEVWRTSWEGALSVPFFAKSNGDWIRSTPATDGTFVYVAGMRDVLVCLEVATGKVVWRVDFVKEFSSELPAFGCVCSPLLDGDAVYVQAGGGTVKLDKRTGKVLWRGFQDGGGMSGSAFSSPIIATLAGRRQIVVQGREKLAGLDPADGKTLWETPVASFRGMNILTPVIFQDGVFTSTYGGRSQWLKIAGAPDALAATEGWSQNEQGYMSTPVIIGSHAYHHLRSQRLVCFELTTGKEEWTSSEKFGKYVSLVAQGEQVLALDERGLLYLIAASPAQLNILSERRVSEEETWAHLAVVGQDLFIRDLKGLAQWRWAKKPKL